MAPRRRVARKSTKTAPSRKQAFGGRRVKLGEPAVLQKDSSYQKTFEFFGVTDFVKNNTQLVTDCPFPDCGKPGKFFTNPASGQWDCKHCQQSGNIYQFIREYHKQWLAYTTEEHYAELSSRRPGILPSTFEKFELAYSGTLKEWLLPAYSSKGDQISNLYVWRTFYDSDNEVEVERVMCTPFFKQIPFGMNLLNRNKKHPIWVAEGQWDCMAWWQCLNKLGDGKNRLSAVHDVVGLPGAGTHPKDHLGIFESRTVNVLMDNDAAGVEGTKRFVNAVSVAGSLPAKVQTLEWPASTIEGYDVRDLCLKSNRAGAAMTYIKRNLKPTKIEAKGIISEGYNPEVEPEACDSFDSLWSQIEQELHTTEAMYDSLAVVMAISVSLNLGDVPLWAFLVGPASSGKSTISAILESATPYSFSVSKLTGMFSGFKSKGDKDHGLVPLIQGKTMVIKDFTTVLTSPPTERDRVFGDLRDLYDGAGAAQYRNNVRRDYKGVRFGIVACVTDAIHAYNQTGLGERFLKCEIDSVWDDAGRMERASSSHGGHIDKAMDSLLESVCNVEIQATGNLSGIQSRAWGLLDNLYEHAEEKANISAVATGVANSSDYKLYVSHLAQLVALARANVERDRDKEITYRPRAELGVRLAKQLMKLTVSLCLVFGVNEPNDRIRRIIRKVALDTAIGFNLEIILAVAHSKSGGLTRDELATKMNISVTKVVRHLSNMKELNIVREVKQKQTVGQHSTRGRRKVVVRLTKDVAELITKLGFNN